jgi:hypothetical protein
VHKNLIFIDKEARFLRELVKQKVDFMIVGLSAAALQGAPVVTQDIDLWFRDLADPGIRKALKKVGATYVPPTSTNPPMFAGNAVNLFDIVVHMHGLGDFEKEKKHSLKIPVGGIKVPVLALERIIKSKKATGRQKDRLVLPVLSDALIAIRESGSATDNMKK